MSEEWRLCRNCADFVPDKHKADWGACASYQAFQHASGLSAALAIHKHFGCVFYRPNGPLAGVEWPDGDG